MMEATQAMKTLGDIRSVKAAKALFDELSEFLKPYVHEQYTPAVIESMKAGIQQILWTHYIDSTINVVMDNDQEVIVALPELKSALEWLIESEKKQDKGVKEACQ